MIGRRFTIIVVALVFAVGVLSAPGSARADPIFTPEPNTSAVVSLLSLTRSSGVLVVKVQIAKNDDLVSAVDAGVAAFGGRWAVTAAVDIAAQGLRCVGRTSATGTFRYICRRMDHSSFPEGKYSLRLPVRRISGKRDRMTGSVYLSHRVVGEQIDETFREWSDTFPVVDSAMHAGSSAEIRSIALLQPYELDSLLTATAYLVLNVTAGDKVQAVTFTLPAGPDWIVWSGYAGDYVWCEPPAAPSTGTNTVVTCKVPYDEPFQPGTYELKIPLQVRGWGPLDSTGSVSLERSDAQFATMDTFPISKIYTG